MQLMAENSLATFAASKEFCQYFAHSVNGSIIDGRVDKVVALKLDITFDLFRVQSIFNLIILYFFYWFLNFVNMCSENRDFVILDPNITKLLEIFHSIFSFVF
jgi:hypothetical protein